MSRLAQSLIGAFSKIPEWLFEQQDAYNKDRERTSPHTRGRAVSAKVAAKRRHAAKKKRQAAKLARRRRRFGRKGKGGARRKNGSKRPKARSRR